MKTNILFKLKRLLTKLSLADLAYLEALSSNFRLQLSTLYSGRKIIYPISTCLNVTQNCHHSYVYILTSVRYR